MSTSSRIDPYTSFNFLVEIEGITSASFSECEGLGAETTVIEYREGGDKGARKLAGQTRYFCITLKRGVTDNRELWQWYREVTKGNVQRRNGSVVLLAADGTEKVRWNFFNAWPCKWAGPSFSAKGNDVAIETLVLAHEGIERA